MDVCLHLLTCPDLDGRKAPQIRFKADCAKVVEMSLHKWDEPNERALRFGLEQGYRALARLTPDRERRIELVDLANEVRPRTWT